MDELILAAPAKEHIAAIADYKQEFLANGESLDGTACLGEAESVEQWLRDVDNNSREETARPGWVPATTLLAIRRADGRLVGMIDIRHRLNDALLNFGGHIGYSVRAGERRKGYAKQMLRLGLAQARALGLKRVLLTCDKTNVASAKTIAANGGALENEIEQRGRVTQRYWIEL